VRPGCPDLFSLVPPDKLGWLNEGILESREPQMRAAARFYGEPFPGPWNGRDYGNAGVMVASKAHRDLFRKPDREAPTPMPEQSYLNLIVQKRRIATHDLPLAFNAMSLCPIPTERAYIIHAAGLRGAARLDRLRSALAPILATEATP